jgi:hypothetical protein
MVMGPCRVPNLTRSGFIGGRFIVLMGLTHLAAILVTAVVAYRDATSVQLGLAIQWPYFLVLVYLPCLWMVLKGTTKPTTSATGW